MTEHKSAIARRQRFPLARLAWRPNPVWVGVAIFFAALVLRSINDSGAYDVFLDETIYSRIAAGAAIHGRLYFGPFPFFLHGPLDFYLQAAVIRLFSIHATAVGLVYAMRHVNSVVGALNAVLVYSLVARFTSRRWGLLAAALFGLDPFIISYDSRVFLEPFAMFWTLCGYSFLLSAVQHRARSGATLAARGHLGGEAGPERTDFIDWTLIGISESAATPSAATPSPVTDKQYRYAVLSGAMFGLALLSKETSEGLYLVPLVWCLLRGRPVSRSFAVVVLIAAACVYAPYPIITAVSGGWHQFVVQKFNGVLRLIGVAQVTGFNKAGAPSFLSRLTADLQTFAMTYVLIGLGFLSTLRLLRRGGSLGRLVALWAAGGFAMLAFQMVQGTLEEQMFYYLVVPSICVVVVGLATAWSRWHTRRRARVLLAVAVLAAFVFDGSVWGIVHFGNDRAAAQAVAWMQRHAPATSRVAPLADGTQFLFPKDTITDNPESGYPATPAVLETSRSQFVITSSLQVDQGYGGAQPSLIAWLGVHAIKRFSATGSTDGTVTIWQLPGGRPDEPPTGPVVLVPYKPVSLGEGIFR